MPTTRWQGRHANFGRVDECIWKSAPTDMAHREFNALSAIHGGPGGRMDSCCHIAQVPTIASIAGNVGAMRLYFPYLGEFYSLREIATSHGRLPAKHIAWIGSRMWAALAVVHASGWVHCAISQSHVLVSPPDHNAMLIDFSSATLEGHAAGPNMGRHDWLMSRSEYLSVQPSLDIGAMAKALTRLLDVASEGGIAMESFLLSLILAEPRHRECNAFEVFDDWKTLLLNTFGEPHFQEFVFPSREPQPQTEGAPTHGRH